MIARIGLRMLRETDFRLLCKFAWNLGWHGSRAVRRFKKESRKGMAFPPFLFISVTNNCNLRCQGCWVTPTRPPHELGLPMLNNIVDTARTRKVRFFGILGGEPLLHKGLFDLFAAHPDCYFLLFTNGVLITADVAARLRSAGNVSPLISIEGLKEVSDTRRGGSEVYARTMEGLDNCRRNRLITGAATSVCKSNIADLVNEQFVKDLIARGAHYLWYYVYRPSGANPTPELALSPEEILSLRRFLVDMRSKHPIMLVDAYWDHDGNALCPAAQGIAYHISPEGFVEPCPPIQIAAERLTDGRDVVEKVLSSSFLKDFRKQSAGATRGCVLLERPDILLSLKKSHQASDSSGRGSIEKELAAMSPHPSHNLKEMAIPEKDAFYKMAKKNFFFGLGAYG